MYGLLAALSEWGQVISTSGSPGRGLRVAAVIAMAVVLAATGTPVMTQTFAAAADVPAGGPGARTVAPINDDRVPVAPNGSVGVQRAKGREKASFRARGTDGHTRVVPGDLPLIVTCTGGGTPAASGFRPAPAFRGTEAPLPVEGAASRRTVRQLTFEVSYDEGGTWAPARTVHGDRPALRHPAEPGTVSLRARLTDGDGNTLVQTVDRACLTVRWGAGPPGVSGTVRDRGPSSASPATGSLEP